MTSIRKILGGLLILAASGRIVPSNSGPADPWKPFPRVTLWTWESRQDLRELSPEKYAVAYLDRTILIADDIITAPRMQPLLLPRNTKIIVVVRIEAPVNRARLDTPNLAARVAEQIIEAVQRNQVSALNQASALQIDFDATRSQRAFYRHVIEETRKRMPARMPLSITALASWCAPQSWLRGLPVDEVVPMLFRMGGDSRFRNTPGWRYHAGEAICRTSVGVSTDEPWPKINPDQRVYVFHRRAWNPKALGNVEKLIAP